MQIIIILLYNVRPDYFFWEGGAGRGMIQANQKNAGRVGTWGGFNKYF